MPKFYNYSTPFIIIMHWLIYQFGRNSTYYLDLYLYYLFFYTIQLSLSLIWHIYLNWILPIKIVLNILKLSRWNYPFYNKIDGVSKVIGIRILILILYTTRKFCHSKPDNIKRSENDRYLEMYCELIACLYLLRLR